MNKTAHIAVLSILLGSTVLTSCASKSGTGGDVISESEDGVTLPPASDVGAVPLPPSDQQSADVKPDAAPEVAEALPVIDSTSSLPESKPELPPAETSTVAAVPESVKVAPTEKKLEKGQFEYTVKSGQTLMQIAYDVYGDIYQWKRIQEMNADKVSSPGGLSEGTVLSVDQTPEDNLSNKEGTPYLIKKGHTLGTISDDVYGTQAKWKRLWENNKKLIKNPNRIYAGFYLYYLFNEQDRIEKEQFRGLQRPAMLQSNPVERGVSSAQ